MNNYFLKNLRGSEFCFIIFKDLNFCNGLQIFCFFFRQRNNPKHNIIFWIFTWTEYRGAWPAGGCRLRWTSPGRWRQSGRQSCSGRSFQSETGTVWSWSWYNSHKTCLLSSIDIIPDFPKMYHWTEVGVVLVRYRNRENMKSEIYCRIGTLCQSSTKVLSMSFYPFIETTKNISSVGVKIAQKYQL